MKECILALLLLARICTSCAQDVIEPGSIDPTPNIPPADDHGASQLMSQPMQSFHQSFSPSASQSAMPMSQPMQSFHQSFSPSASQSVMPMSQPMQSFRQSISPSASQSVMPMSSAITTAPPTRKVLFQCNFERDACSPASTGDYWERRNGSTPSYDTGPSVDATTGTSAGHYIHYESSNPPSDNIDLLEYILPPTRSHIYCISFAYHMYGSDIGTLRVGVQNPLPNFFWQMSGNKGDRWHRVQISHLSVTSPFFPFFQPARLIFEARRLRGWESDFAIDDIVVTERCDDSNTTTTTTSTPPSTTSTTEPTCEPGRTRCPNSICIPDGWICDGEDDCADGWDESSCSRTTTDARSPTTRPLTSEQTTTMTTATTTPVAMSTTSRPVIITTTPTATTTPLSPVTPEFLPFGRSMGDSNVRSGDDTNSCFSVSRNFPLFSTKNHNQICVTSNGYLTVDNSVTSTSAPLGQRSYAVLAPYTDDMRSSGQNIFYRTVSDTTTLRWVNSNVARKLSTLSQIDSFNARQAIVVTYDMIERYDNRNLKYKYQLVLATDFDVTFAIMSYERLDTNGNRPGFSEPPGGNANTVYFTTSTSQNRNLVGTSNIGVRGRHVYLLSKVKCKDCTNPGVMYPYGSLNGDRTYSRTYDFDQQFRLNGNWKLFSKSRNDLWISSQGYIRLQSGSFSLPATSQYDYISPYYDPYVNGVRTVYYRESSERNLLANVTRDIKSIERTFTANRVFLVTYEITGRKFQVALATNGRETYAVLNYEDLDTNPRADVEMNEAGCGRKVFARRSNALNFLIKATNTTTGVRGRHAFKLSEDCVNEGVMYPYGRFVGDNSYSSGSHFTRSVYLNRNWKLFSRPSRQLYFSSMGYLGPQNTNYFTPSTTSYSYLAPFYDRTNNYRESKTLYYRETTDRNLLIKFNEDIQSTGTNFNTTRAYIITYVFPARKFQVVLATNDEETYAILNYQELDRDPLTDIELHELGCGNNVFYRQSNAAHVLIRGNSTGVRGRHVFSLAENCVNRGVMFSYGSQNGDRTIYRPSQYIRHRVQLNETFMFFSTPEDKINIHGRGFLTPDPYTQSYLNQGLTYLSTFYSTNSITYDAIYYRDTTDPVLLRELNQAIESNGTMFTPSRAFVVTYIAPARKFQTVLATDGSTTYAVLNYEELDANPSEDVQVNEPGCRLKRFISRSNGAQRLIQTNTSSNARGRHIFNLTIPGCYKIVSGVRTKEYGRNYVSRGLQLRTETHNILAANEIGDVDLQFTDLTPLLNYDRQTQVSVVLKSTEKTPVRGRYQLTYATFTGSQKGLGNLFVKHSHLFVLKNTPKTPSFQYGNLNFSTVESDTVCQRKNFDLPMMSTPTIKITPIVSFNKFSPTIFVNAWLKDVTVNGFTACIDETVTFSGKRDVTVNYIAVTEKSNHLSEIQKVHITPKNSHTVCMKQKLQNIYLSEINVFASVETSSASSQQPVLAWTRLNSNSRYIDVCLKSKQQDTMHKVHLLVKGDVSPCSNFSCPDHLQCRLASGRQPFCGCIENCTGGQEICGSDYKSYRSECYLNQQHCRRFGNTSKTEVTIKHYGECQIKPLQSGRTQLEPVAELPGVFCKYVNIDSENFVPETGNNTIKVLLSTSWNQQDNFVKANQASATWSEDITKSGFKACVLVAGRHLATYFSSPPFVHWIAVQNQDFKSDQRVVEVGSQTMDTWYTGTQCKIMTTLRYDETLYASVSHAKPRSYNNVMTVWIEKERNSGWWQNVNSRVCARELQNFDGVHDGIVIHWMKVRVRTVRPDVFMPDHIQMNFPRRTIALGQENPAECKTKIYNNEFPSLSNPTVLVTGTHETGNGSSSSSIYSQRDFAVWIEQTKGANITVCVKSLRSSITRNELTVNLIVIADLCDGFGTYHEGSCYKKLPQGLSFDMANAQCLVQGASLPVISSTNEGAFIQENIKGATWLNLKRSPPNTGEWGWADGTSFVNGTMWYPGQPTNMKDHNCAVVDNRGIQTGWRDEHCSASRSVICEKDARLVERSCESYCANDGICSGNSTGLSCQCRQGFYGKRCELNINLINECSNYTTHNEPWRHFENTEGQSNETSCDSRELKHGWHRFIGQGGSRLYNQCSNSTRKCGTHSPGYLSGTLPKQLAEVRNMRIYFFTFYCADDYGRVVVRNCGDFMVYSFSYLPSFSCNYGICTY